MAGQTSIGSPAVALAGLRANAGYGRVETFALKTADIDAGLYVTDAGSGQAERPDATGEVTAIASQGGIVLLKTARDPQEGAQYQVYETIPVLVEGEVYVTSETAVTKGNPVCVRFASGSQGTTLGALMDGVVSNESVALPRAYWAETTSGAGIAMMRLEAIS
jgi:hypothetical protein